VERVVPGKRRGPGERVDERRFLRNGLDAVEDTGSLERGVDLRDAGVELLFRLPLERQVVGSDDSREPRQVREPLRDLERREGFGREVEVNVAVHGKGERESARRRDGFLEPAVPADRS